jgi:hypothetical protein
MCTARSPRLIIIRTATPGPDPSSVGTASANPWSRLLWVFGLRPGVVRRAQAGHLGPQRLHWPATQPLAAASGRASAPRFSRRPGRWRPGPPSRALRPAGASSAGRAAPLSLRGHIVERDAHCVTACPQRSGPRPVLDLGGRVARRPDALAAPAARVQMHLDQPLASQLLDELGIGRCRPRLFSQDRHDVTRTAEPNTS